MSAKRRVTASIIKTDKPITKEQEPTHLKESDSASVWIPRPVDMSGYEALVDESSILPQCIRAYGGNIAGFGLAVRYREDNGEETEEMKTEWKQLENILECLNFDMPAKEVFERLVELREEFGVAYLEIIRNAKNEVVGVELITDIPSIEKSKELGETVDVNVMFGGEIHTRRKRFCKYRQTKNGKTVYFREFGDMRTMSIRTGEYVNKGLTDSECANEILEFAIGTADYGKVRWIGQVLGISGAAKAENLNYNYFGNGRHTPLAIVVSGGTLSNESMDKLQEYINGIKGETGQHAFLLLQVEADNGNTEYETANKPTVELKDMAAMLQKDELFQDYLDNNRRKVQSAFRLPDIYTGYTTDFNRATAQTAMEITEKQVFQPERASLAWVINHKLLAEYGFKYVEVYFREPDITNPDDISNLLQQAVTAGGVTPNMAKRFAYETLGWDGEEDFEGDWANVPLAAQPQQSGYGAFEATQLDAAIAKAAGNRDEDVAEVLKTVRRLLEERKNDEAESGQ